MSFFLLAYRFPHDDSSAKLPTTSDEAIFQFLTESYAQTHPTMLQSENPCHVLDSKAPSGIIHGQALEAYKNSLLEYTYNNMPEVFSVCIKCVDISCFSKLYILFQILFFITLHTRCYQASRI